MKFLLLLLPIFAQAESFYFEGVPTIKNGFYEDMQKSQTALIVENGIVRICGFSTYIDGKKGYVSRRWSQMGPYLYAGRYRVGTYENNRLFMEQRVSDGQKQILLLQWDDASGKYVYSMKHPALGGFQVEGNKKQSSNPELDEACSRDSF